MQSAVAKWESLRRHDLKPAERAELVTAVLQEVHALAGTATHPEKGRGVEHAVSLSGS